VSGQLHALPLYPQGKSPWYPLDRRLDGPQNHSGCGGEEKNHQPLPSLEPPIIQPVAQRIPVSCAGSHLMTVIIKVKGNDKVVLML